MFTLIPPCAGKYMVPTTTLKMRKLFNQSVDIKVGYFGIFELVESQKARLETFSHNPTIFTDNPPNHNKTMAEKELYVLSKLCMFGVFIHILGFFYVGTDNVDD